ncbi:hypothetical protein ACROYT_G029816 [Oculina patagonica]
MSQPTDASNDFVEFVQLWGGTFHMYLQAVIKYDSRSGGFTVQVGQKIGEKTASNGQRVQLITIYGATIELERQKQGKYKLTVTHSSIKDITVNKAYLPNQK